ncbi:MAG TPA: proteasome subunit alpha [Streptosporangiaceae bacterium]|jgi:proteasome alpha subunit|nr:proteasome subunit alpha [Streptosporangiaceae bacterium]
MPFYVSPEQVVKDKADFARKNIARGRNVIVIQYADGILFVAPNLSRALHKISEIYDRIAFGAVGMYNEFENLRKAGVRYADFNGYLYDRNDVTALGLANAYGQTLGTIFSESNKPYEVEIVVAEVGSTPERDQMYRITFDGFVADERQYVAMGGQAEQLSVALKERYRDGMSLVEALGAALGALEGQAASNGEDVTAAQLEVGLLARTGERRRFRRLTGARLEELLAEARPAQAEPEDAAEASDDGPAKGTANGTANGAANGKASGSAPDDEAGGEPEAGQES